MNTIKYFLDLLAAIKLIKEEKFDWEDGVRLNLKHIQNEEMVFSIVENFAGDLLLEFPINEILSVVEYLELNRI